jgi:hypothetical protein
VIPLGGLASAGSYDDVSAPSRSSRRGSENRARSQLINVRVNEDERERWSAFAQSKGMPLAGLMRLAVESAILQDQMAETMRRAGDEPHR